MPQSLSKVLVHIVFSTKRRHPYITPEIQPELYALMGFIIKRLSGIPLIINGIQDHVHILATLPRTVTQAKFVEEIKRQSSRWIKTKGAEFRYFRWQNGYGIFSVSYSGKDTVVRYIENQQQHHLKKDFKNELILFFEKYEVPYDEKYLFD